MKITCDVIQDLMPSYIDGILSEDSQGAGGRTYGYLSGMQKNVGDHERGAGKRTGSDKIICSLHSRIWSRQDGKY